MRLLFTAQHGPARCKSKRLGDGNRKIQKEKKKPNGNRVSVCFARSPSAVRVYAVVSIQLRLVSSSSLSLPNHQKPRPNLPHRPPTQSQIPRIPSRVALAQSQTPAAASVGVESGGKASSLSLLPLRLDPPRSDRLPPRDFESRGVDWRSGRAPLVSGLVRRDRLVCGLG